MRHSAVGRLHGSRFRRRSASLYTSAVAREICKSEPSPPATVAHPPMAVRAKALRASCIADCGTHRSSSQPRINASHDVMSPLPLSPPLKTALYGKWGAGLMKSPSLRVGGREQLGEVKGFAFDNSSCQISPESHALTQQQLHPPLTNNTLGGSLVATWARHRLRPTRARNRGRGRRGGKEATHARAHVLVDHACRSFVHLSLSLSAFTGNVSHGGRCRPRRGKVHAGVSAQRPHHLAPG